jgi:hypothetical protein
MQTIKGVLVCQQRIETTISYYGFYKRNEFRQKSGSCTDYQKMETTNHPFKTLRLFKVYADYQKI